MVAKTATRTSAAASSKSKPSSSASASQKQTKAASTSLVQSSASKALKTKSKKKNKFRDSEQRQLLDGQTTDLFAPETTSGGHAKGDKADPFSYNVPSQAEVRRTRKQVDEAADALDDLMRSF